MLAGLLLVGVTQLEFPEEAAPEKPSEQVNVEQKLAALEKEVEQLKEKNDKLTVSEEKKDESNKPKARDEKR